MRFSVWCTAGQPWDEIVTKARHAEATGWDGLWLADHFMSTAGGARPVPPQECLSLLAALAASVPRVRIGSLVLGNTYRHPAVVANVASTIDAISGGRFVLGLGAGWQPNEHEAYGIDLPPVKQRLDRLEEAAEIITRLLAGETVDFAGQHYELHQAIVEPGPVQDRLPLLLGGAGEKRTPSIVARFADEWNSWGSPAVHAHKKPILDAACERIGRDPATVARSTQVMVHISEDEAELAPYRAGEPSRPTLAGTPEEWIGYVQAWADAGIDEVIVPDFTFGTGQACLDKLDLFNERVASQFR
jgi:F420-dependent oxidoreductase-like protein